VKHLSEYRDAHLVRGVLREIEGLVSAPRVVM
jgi:hypothetical protein